MKTLITEREIIKLNNTQNRMIHSGWGKEVISHSVVEKITYISDDLKIKGYLAYPENLSEGKKIPLVIWNRGGYLESGAIDKFTARGMFGQIASWGYAVLASQYRGNDGGEGKEELGGRDVNDIINLINIADGLKFIDTSGLGVEGWSRGGMMTFLMLKEEYKFKCAVLSGAISNLKAIADSDKKSGDNYKKIIGSNDFENKLKKRSAIYFTDLLPDIPYLIMHGGNDGIIPVEQTIELAKKFSIEKKHYRLVIFEDGDHYLKNHRKEVDQLRKFWFDKYLGLDSEK